MLNRPQDQRHARADRRQLGVLEAAGRTSIIAPPCTPCPVVSPCAPRAQRGFTLIEMMIGVAVAGVLSTVAVPSFEAQLQKARRSDALISVMQVQASQERFRANGTRYGTLAEIGIAATSPARHYTLEAIAPNSDGYVLLATATGTQARDAACRVLKLSASGVNWTYTSGADATTANAADINRRCWNL